MRTCEIFDGAYTVYEDGRVWSNKSGKFLLGGLTTRKRNYKYVTIMVNGQQKSVGVHRLVAECFIPNPCNKPEVNHINGDPSKNDVSNLEWCTRKENVRHAFQTGLMNNMLNTKKCKCGELIKQKSDMCAKCLKKEERIAKRILERNAEADGLKIFCRSEQDKQFLSLWRTGITYREIGDLLGVTKQCVDEKHKTLLGRKARYRRI